MARMTVDQALDNLDHAQARGHMSVDLEVRVANLHAAVQAEAAETMAEASRDAARTMAVASDSLRSSIDAFTQASNAGTTEIAKWSKLTAQSTMALTFATGALVIAAAIQVGVMLWTSN